MEAENAQNPKKPSKKREWGDDMTRSLRHPTGLLTALQAFTIFAGIGGVLLAVSLGAFAFTFTLMAVSDPELSAANIAAGIAVLLVMLIVSVCSLIALGSLFGVLQRAKRETFTPRNIRALGRMARCCGISAAVMLTFLLCWGVWARWIDALIVLLLWPFAFAFAGLIFQSIRLLMARALQPQPEASAKRPLRSVRVVFALLEVCALLAMFAVVAITLDAMPVGALPIASCALWCVLLGCFLCMADRIRREPDAFTDRNASSLRNIAVCCVVLGILTAADTLCTVNDWLDALIFLLLFSGVATAAWTLRRLFPSAVPSSDEGSSEA